MFGKLIALFAVVMPLPDFKITGKVLEWWTRIGPAAADFISALASQIKTKGTAEIELPGGAVIAIYELPDGTFGMSEMHNNLLCAAAPGADGKWLEFIKAILPLIMQLLPLFIKQVDPPSPEPEIV